MISPLGLLYLTSTSIGLVTALQGQATTYGGNVSGGMCSFSTYTLPSGIYGTAMSDSNWAGSEICGACISVTGPTGKTIKAMVVDQCPRCGTNHLDLFTDAYTVVGGSPGVVDVTWDIVACDITSPIRLRAKEGATKYWFSMQVINANYRVEKLEVSTDGGKTWKSATRQPYNFFEISSGTGADSVSVKITGANSKSIQMDNVSVNGGVETTGTSNF